MAEDGPHITMLHVQHFNVALVFFWCRCVVSQARPWCFYWSRCDMTQVKPWCSCWCPGVVTQPKLFPERSLY